MDFSCIIGTPSDNEYIDIPLTFDFKVERNEFEEDELTSNSTLGEKKGMRVKPLTRSATKTTFAYDLKKEEENIIST